MKDKVVGVVREGLPLVAKQPETSEERFGSVWCGTNILISLSLCLV